MKRHLSDPVGAISKIIVVAAATLSAIFTALSFWQGQDTFGPWAPIGWIALTVTLPLGFASLLIWRQPKPGFLFAIVGSIAGLSMIAYLHVIHFSGVEKGYLIYIVSLVASVAGLRRP